ncbi:MAG: hypothetical protein E7347_04630 [Clostridiales bacterium]|nr:hypothetical protein [Clostridiales bacterium]
MDETKSLKQYCREAKKRLKQGFWQNYSQNLDKELAKAESLGVSTSKVKEYYTCKITENIKNSKDEFEEFYKKVKTLLDAEGEVSNAIGRLTDKEHFDSLPYDERQRYTLNLSEKYLRAVERYKKEKALQITE